MQSRAALNSSFSSALGIGHPGGLPSSRLRTASTSQGWETVLFPSGRTGWVTTKCRTCLFNV